MSYGKIAKEVIQFVGGKDNIQEVMHCATRLRLRLKDASLVQESKLQSVDKVKGTFAAKGQYQIIFGSGTVNLVCSEVKKQLGHEEVSEEVQKEEGNWLQRGVKILSDIFVPIIPAIVAGGLLMGLNNILTAAGLIHESKSIIEVYPQFKDLASAINLFANAPFVFLPVLLGFSATKKFGGNPYLGAALGMIMVHPDLMNAYSYANATEIPSWNILGLTIETVGYQGTVLPVLAVSWILAKLEINLRKITPTWLDNLTTPLLSILITAFITFIFVGPILREAGWLMADGITWLYDSLGFVGAAIFGFFYAPIVITGLHHSFSAVETTLLASVGETFIFTTASMSNVAQGSAVLAILFLSKDSKIKSLCSASGISALLGITEPAMFGVNLKLKFPFVAAMIGSGVGSAYLAITNVKATALGAAGIPGFLSIAPSNYVNFAIGLVLTMITTIAVTIILFKRDAAKQLTMTSEQTTSNSTVYAPMSGKIAPLSTCSDEMFASLTMGDGFVITPTNGNVVAPFDACVKMIFPTKHAIGLQRGDGVEVLIHCGIDTVNMNGEAFQLYVEEGQQVTKGTRLIQMDLEKIKEAGYSTETMTVFTSKHTIEEVKGGSIDEGSEVCKLD